MARPLRLKSEGAWYRVMNRGAVHQRSQVFSFITYRRKLPY